jgi:hypothetical protein
MALGQEDKNKSLPERFLNPRVKTTRFLYYFNIV